MSILPRTIQVKVGDSLTNIAYEVLGNYSSWRDIAYFNNLNIFEDLKVGSLLNTPVKEEIEKVLDAASNEVSELNNKAQSVVNEILNSRQGKTITKILGVDKTQLLKDLDLSSLSKSIAGISTELQGIPEWNLLNWVL